MVTRVGRGVFLVVSRAHISKKRGSSTPQYFGFTSIYPLTDQTRLGSTHGKGLVLRESARPPSQGVGGGGATSPPMFGVSLYFYLHQLHHSRDGLGEMELLLLDSDRSIAYRLQTDDNYCTE